VNSSKYTGKLLFPMSLQLFTSYRCWLFV